MTGRLVVTGMGVVSALGHDLEAFFTALLEGRCGSRRVERFSEQGLRHDVAAIVERQSILDRLSDEERAMPWASAMATVAIRSALRDAGLEPRVQEAPLYVACTIGSPAAVERPGVAWADLDPTEPATVSRYAQGTMVSEAARAVGATGEVSCLVTTCAAGNYAIGSALDTLRDGRVDRVVAGGVEELSTIPFTAFHQIRALGEVCRPFDAHRSGLLFGEGAAFVVVETVEAARQRGARIYAQLLSVGYSNDAHHLVAPEPKGAGAALALRRALKEASVEPEEVGYINAHGTATALNDQAEASALYDVFGAAVRSLPVSSTKGATGHMMGAASAAEAVATILAVHRGQLPPTTGLEEPDETLGLHLIRSAPLKKNIEVALSSGFGFGGNNAVLAVGTETREPPRSASRNVYVHSGAALVGESLGLAPVWGRVTADETLSADGVAGFEPAAVLGKKGLRHVDRGALLLASALETDLAGWPSVERLRAGAVFGGAYPAYSSIIALLRDMQRGGPTKVNPMLVPFATSNCAPSWWLLRRGITGYNGSTGSGECAGLDAILLAAMQIRRGRIDTAVAGGVEAQTPELWEGLRRLGRLDGPISEAIGAAVLSCEPDGAWARLAGSASAFDRAAPTQALAWAVSGALAQAGYESVDLAVSQRAGIDLPASEHRTFVESLGETLGVSGALAFLFGAMEIARGAQPARTVLAVAHCPEGYATAVVLEAVSNPKTG